MEARGNIAAPSVAIGNNEVQVAATGADGSLNFYFAVNGSSTFTKQQGAPPVSALGQPAIAINPVLQYPVIAARGPNKSLSAYQGSRFGWNSKLLAPAGTAHSAPSMQIESDSVDSIALAEIAVEGPNHNLMNYEGRGPAAITTWSSFQVAGPNTTFAAPSVGFLLETPRVAVEGPNNTLNLYADSNPTVLFKIAPAGTTFSGPSIVADSIPGFPAVMDFAVEGVNNTWNFYMLGPFPEPRERVGGVGSTFSMPVITSNSSDGSLDVAVKGPSKSLLFYTAARGTATPTFTGMPVAGPGTTQK